MALQSTKQRFCDAARRFATQTAIDRGGRRITYAELERQSNRMANALLRRGAVNGALVAVVADDPIEVSTALLGVLKSGGIFMPLDPSFPLNRLQTMTSQAEPQFYVVEERCAELSAQIGASPESCLNLNEIDREDDTCPDVSRSADDGCSIYFTSGSTGRPKAILGRLSGIDHFVRWEIEALGIGPGTRVSQLASPSFDGFLKDVFVPLCAGGTVCAPESRSVVLDAARLADWVDIEGLEVLQCVPSVFRSLLNLKLEPHYFEALKWVVLAGEPLLPSDVQRWADVFGDRVRLVNLYGPTETTVTKFAHFVQTADSKLRSVPIGKPIRGAAAIVLDGGGQPCGAGDVGEIYIRTPYRALGYYGDPELTRQAFVQNPFSSDPDDIVYRTGDFGRVLNDGNFEFLGRRDQQVKIRGVRVELGEVESLLCGHPSVREAAVVDREDAGGNKYLCAYVVLKNGDGASGLRQHLADRLPEFMQPSAIVTLEELPRTLNGKIDRKALPTLEQAREQQGAGTEYRPRTAVEEIVAGIWSEVLRLPRVGLEENFFELGGHSLLATQIISRVREALQVDLPLRVLFEAPSAGALAERIEEERQQGTGVQNEPIRRVERNGELALSYAQQRMWFLEQLAEGSAAYHLAMGLRAMGSLNIGLLEQTWQEVVRRHEVLRTSFPARQGEPVQVIGRAERVRLPLVDLGRLGEEERVGEAERISGEQAQRSFDLSRGPLVRAVLVRLQESEHVVLFTMHHIISDGWSFQVVTRELNRLYESYGGGQVSSLSELGIQYADYAAWQRTWLSGEQLQERLEYWRKQLEGAEVRLQLPQRQRRPAVQRHRGRRQEVALDGELVRGLRELSRRQGSTLYMTLLSGFAALLYQYTGQDEVVVGSVIANREREEVEQLIGFVANTLVLRVNVGGEPSFGELMRRVRETCLGAYAHQMPPEKLVEGLGRQG